MYPSDVTREQFSAIEYELQSGRKAAHPPNIRPVCHFCAILYVLKEGCAWRGLPHGFPKWNIVCHYRQIWSVAGKNGEASLFDRVLRELVVCGRVIHGREAKTTMAIMDFKRVKNADTAEKKDMTGEETSGVKPRIAVDASGLPHAV
jgi:transposase